MEKLPWLFEEQKQKISDMEIRKINSGISFKLSTELIKDVTGISNRIFDLWFDVAFLKEEVAVKISMSKKEGIILNQRSDLNLSRNIVYGSKYYDVFKSNIGKYKLDRIEENVLFFKKEE